MAMGTQITILHGIPLNLSKQLAWDYSHNIYSSLELHAHAIFIIPHISVRYIHRLNFSAVMNTWHTSW